MRDDHRTREQLFVELAQFRQRTAEPEICQGELQRLQEALRDSEEQCRVILDHASEGLVKVDRNLVVSAIDQRRSEMMALRPGDCVGERLADLNHILPPASSGIILRALEQLVADKEVEWHEVTLRRADGSLVDARITARPISVEGRTTDGMLVVCDITGHEHVEQAQLKRAHDLKERIKELNCLYGIANLVETAGLRLAEIIQGTVDLIPAAWQWPEIACARATLEGQEYRTDNFQETAWKLSADIVVHGVAAGTLEVCYLTQASQTDRSPFLKEESDLISAIVQRLGRIIERIRAQEALRESEERYRSFVEHFQGIAFRRNLDFTPKFCLCHGAVEEITGYTEEECAAEMPRWDQVIHPDDLADVYKSTERLIAVPDYPVDRQYRIVRKDGQVRWVRELVQNVYDDSGRPAFVQGALYDITERKRAEERSLRLARQLVSAQEEERRHISRELHDELGQALTFLRIQLGLMQNDLGPQSESFLKRMSEAVVLTDATIERMRVLAQDLRPPGLDAVGLNLTLEGFCRTFARRTGLSVDYTGEELRALPEAANISFYRYLQEALTNVAKHAHASHIQVKLSRDNGEISLSVEDDGRGFCRQAQESSSGLGLLGVRERLESLGARLEIESWPGQGTRLSALMPW